MKKLAFLILALVTLGGPRVQAGEVWLIDMNGAIGPAMADHVTRSLDSAEAGGAEAVILRMDTPGGLDQAMRDIIHHILAAEVPVIGYVAPAGSRAASAGTYILYASHLAAMAPATNLGAATPVQLGGGGSLPSTGKSNPETQDESSKHALSHKMVNDATAYIRGLAELRGRNAAWAEQAVTYAATLTASAALNKNVIDLVAADIPRLLAAADGREIRLGEATHHLQLADATLKRVEADWRSRFLQVITNPNIAYLLLIVGIYGLIFEFASPGIGAGAAVGGICLLLAAYALQMLPISYSALGLLLLGLGLLAAEAFSPSFGILGLGGVAAFIGGSILLMDSNVPGYDIALPVILALAASSAVFLVVVLRLLRKTRYQPSSTGLANLEGQTAEVGQLHHGIPMALLDGEWWQLRSPEPLALHDKVRITRAEGLVLDAKKED